MLLRNPFSILRPSTLLSSSYPRPWSLERLFHAAARLARHRYAYKHPITADGRERQVDAAKVRRVQVTIYRLLQARRSAAAADVFYGWLAHTPRDSPYRASAYDAVITQFLDERAFSEAAGIRARMNAEGLQPSPTLSLRLQALNIVQTATSESKALKQLKKVFQDERYDEDELLLLLVFLEEAMKCPYPLVEQIVETFRQAQPRTYQVSPEIVTYLVALYANGGKRGDAEAWLSRYRQQAKAESKPNPAPYTALLRATNPHGQEQYNAVLKTMDEDGVAPDRVLYNMLIAAQVRLRRYDKAFALYRTLASYPEPSMVPDAFTFAPLFRGIERAVREPILQNDVPTPRALFRDMLAAHMRLTDNRPATPSRVLTPSSLRDALRVFCGLLDFAGAYVVARTMLVTRVAPTLDTYKTLFTAINARATRALVGPLGGDEQWLAAFTAPIAPDINRMNSLGMSFEVLLTVSMLRFGGEASLNAGVADHSEVTNSADESAGREVDVGDLAASAEGDGARVVEGGREDAARSLATDSCSPLKPQAHLYPMPTAEMVLGHLGAADTTFSAVPLMRIIRRAIFAGLPTAAMTIHSSQSVSAAIIAARTAMVPKSGKDRPATLAKAREGDGDMKKLVMTAAARKRKLDRRRDRGLHHLPRITPSAVG